MERSQKGRRVRKCEINGALIAGNKSEIEQATNCDECHDQLSQMQRLEPVLSERRSWPEIAGLMRSNAADNTLKEKILVAALRIHSQHRNRQSTHVLVLLMWHVLVRSHRVAWPWDADVENRWQNTFVQFLRVLAEYDPARETPSHATLLFYKTVRSCDKIT